jgi:RNA polymerase sigma factor (TIGR02999 family)
MTEITRILAAIEQGVAGAAEKLLPLVYDELRKLAAQKMAHEKPGQTLQATALVHEAYLLLVGPSNERQWNSRGHFFGAAAEAMRRILIMNARRRNAEKRGGGCQRIELDAALLPAGERDDRLLLLDDALTKLEQEQPDRARIVKLRFFAGLTNAEAAITMGISDTTADRYWAYARAWLQREMAAEGGAAGGSNDLLRYF